MSTNVKHCWGSISLAEWADPPYAHVVLVPSADYAEHYLWPLRRSDASTGVVTVFDYIRTWTQCGTVCTDGECYPRWDPHVPDQPWEASITVSSASGSGQSNTNTYQKTATTCPRPFPWGAGMSIGGGVNYQNVEGSLGLTSETLSDQCIRFSEHDIGQYRMSAWATGYSASFRLTDPMDQELFDVLQQQSDWDGTVTVTVSLGDIRIDASMFPPSHMAPDDLPKRFTCSAEVTISGTVSGTFRRDITLEGDQTSYSASLNGIELGRVTLPITALFSTTVELTADVTISATMHTSSRNAFTPQNLGEDDASFSFSAYVNISVVGPQTTVRDFPLAGAGVLDLNLRLLPLKQPQEEEPREITRTWTARQELAKNTLR